MIINCVINQAFRETNLKQIGRQPRFFDVKNPVDLSNVGLKMWSGFKASALQTVMGCTVAIDNIFKFATTQTVLERIRQIKDKAYDNKEYRQQVCDEFVNKSIIADWGNMRTYIVSDVDFEKNPVSYSFDYNNSKIRVAEYFS